MPDEKFQHGAFAGADAQLRNGPAQALACMDAEPLLGVRMPVMTKSELTISLMRMSVAPVLEILAARSANSCSKSAASGVTATWAASGSVAQSFRALTSSPSEPTRPMQ